MLDLGQQQASSSISEAAKQSAATRAKVSCRTRLGEPFDSHSGGSTSGELQCTHFGFNFVSKRDSSFAEHTCKFYMYPLWSFVFRLSSLVSSGLGSRILVSDLELVDHESCFVSTKPLSRWQCVCLSVCPSVCVYSCSSTRPL